MKSRNKRKGGKREKFKRKLRKKRGNNVINRKFEISNQTKCGKTRRELNGVNYIDRPFNIFDIMT